MKQVDRETVSADFSDPHVLIFSRGVTDCPAFQRLTMRVVFLLLLLLLPLPLSVHAEDLGALSANPARLSGSFGLSSSLVGLPVRPTR